MATTIRDVDHGFARMLKQAGIKADLRVGVLQDEQHKDSDMTVAELGALFEIGGGTMPARPWLRPVVDGRLSFIQARVRRVAEAVLLKGLAPDQGMQLLGFEIVRLIQARIRAGIPPALKEATKARKTNAAGGFKDIPLIFTGQFIGKITAEARSTR